MKYGTKMHIYNVVKQSSKYVGIEHSCKSEINRVILGKSLDLMKLLAHTLIENRRRKTSVLVIIDSNKSYSDSTVLNKVADEMLTPCYI